MIDEDTVAFNRIMDTFRLPRGNKQEEAERNRAIQEATKYAIEVPFQVMKKSYESMEVIKAMAEIGNPNSVSDAGVGALAARSAVMGAFLNVKINSANLDDKAYVDEVLEKGKKIEEKTIELEREILNIVNSKI